MLHISPHKLAEGGPQPHFATDMLHEEDSASGALSGGELLFYQSVLEILDFLSSKSP